jgi:hypothetical protein
MSNRKTKTLAERFWSKVEVRGLDECWEWQGGKQSGYGCVFIGCREGQVGAHRAVWFLTRGAWPAALDVCHSCDNRACVNPTHLWVGTATDNLRDCKAKGRVRFGRAVGDAHPCTKISEAAIPVFRAWVEAGFPPYRVAPHFGIATSQAYRIVNGEARCGHP